MKHSLEDLKSGKLVGLKNLKLACNLTEFPEEIITLSETLEILDLSDNQLTTLPHSISQLKKLKIIFFAKNNFTEFPTVLGKLPLLNMIGFKSNRIQTVAENAFPPLLKWLILTDNKIKKIPKSIGNCHLLQKCTIAGNEIEALPIEMANCLNLELLRVSANKLASIPNWLFKLPKLSWVAFGGNPATHKNISTPYLNSVDWKDITLKNLLGEGASGFISKAIWNTPQKEVAVKVFKGNVTSDGLPEDEMKIAVTAGKHDTLITVLGKVKNHPENKSALIMELIPTNYSNLGNPPSIKTCTRDTFNKDTNFTKEQLLKIAKSIASVCTQLHNKGINHGDLYAHNILINNDAACLLGDFGAASFYDINTHIAHNIEKVEVRAYGCLLEDILKLTGENKTDTKLHNQWLKLITDCAATNVSTRPTFAEISKILEIF